MPNIPDVYKQLNFVPIGLTVSEWKEVGAYANSLIQNDMTEGKFQNGQSGLAYRSAQYKRYKANDMRRLTSGEATHFQVNSQSGIVTKQMHFGSSTKLRLDRKSGKLVRANTGRLSGYSGKPISSNNTAFVDMTLTGRLKRSLRVVTADRNSVTCGYLNENNAAGKIEGNAKLGRVILGLSPENVTKVKEFIKEIMQRKIQGFNQTINIDIKY